MKKAERLAREAALRPAELPMENQMNDSDNQTVGQEDAGRNRYLMVVEGLLPNPGVWVRLLDREADRLLTEAEAEEIREQLSQLLEIVSRSYRDGERAVLTLGSAKINVQSFAAIRMEVIRL